MSREMRSLQGRVPAAESYRWGLERSPVGGTKKNAEAGGTVASRATLELQVGHLLTELNVASDQSGCGCRKATV